MAVEIETSRNSLVFAVNGERFELASVDPSTTVLEFLRSQTRFKSVKLGCGEGWFLSLCVALTAIFVMDSCVSFVLNNGLLTFFRTWALFSMSLYYTYI